MKKTRIKKRDDAMQIFVMEQGSKIFLDGGGHGMVRVGLLDDYVEVIACKGASVVFLRQE